MLNPAEPIQNRKIFIEAPRPPFQPFTLYIRGLEQTGYEKHDGRSSTFFDMSRLSKGVRCAMQGCKY